MSKMLLDRTIFFVKMCLTLLFTTNFFGRWSKEVSTIETVVFRVFQFHFLQEPDSLFAFVQDKKRVFS